MYMNVCMYVCMCVCVCIYIYIYIYVYPTGEHNNCSCKLEH